MLVFTGAPLTDRHPRTQVPVQQNTSNFNPDPDTWDTVSLLKYGLQYKLKLINGNKPENRANSLCKGTKTRDFVVANLDRT